MVDLEPAESWDVREGALDLTDDGLRHAESLFALSNGHIGLRGNLDENEPRGMPGTYLNSLYEVRDLTYPEQGYGFPERGESIIDAPNGKVIQLYVDDEPFDVRHGTVRHERILDLRAGTLRREVEWVSSTGAAVTVTSVRLVSFPHSSVAAVRYRVQAADPATRLRVESRLLANEEQPEPRDDPRAATIIHHPLRGLRYHGDEAGGVLLHRTRRSGIGVASAVAHTSPQPGTVTCDEHEIRWSLAATGSLWFDKTFAYAWDEHRSDDELVAAAVTDRDAAVAAGFDKLLRVQRDFLDEFWSTADVEIDGDPEVQQAVRFGLFHVLQAGAQAGPHPIPAKGLTGNGYDGHTLWDTETFVLPVLTYTHPACVGSALRWRHSILPAARERAAELRLAGATYAWRTISGPECSGYWPAGTAALHVNADIADAVLRYYSATGDDAFMAEAGREILLETARLWCRVAHADDTGVYHIAGITGPDEYTALMDDNIFTNLMAQANLRGAAEHCADLADPGEVAAWRTVADRLAVPYDERRRVHQQAAGFTQLEEWDFENTPAEDYPLLLHFPYLDLYRKQVVKQADVVLAMALRGDAFTDQEKARNFAYYEARTVRDSSLSAPAQAVLAAETGHLELAHDYLAEAALLDLRGGRSTSADGLHIASCAGAWIALVMGFGGFRDTHGRVSFAPRLPDHLPRLKFTIRWRRSTVSVTVTPHDATYEVSGEQLTLHHHGHRTTLRPGERTTLPIPPISAGQPPAAPHGRAPRRRVDDLD